MRIAITILIAVALAGCSNHRLSGYNLKASVGQTDYDNGSRSLYTGASVDAHFDVK